MSEACNHTPVVCWGEGPGGYYLVCQVGCPKCRKCWGKEKDTELEAIMSWNDNYPATPMVMGEPEKVMDLDE